MDANQTVISPQEDCSKPTKPKRPKKSKRSKNQKNTKKVEEIVEDVPDWSHLPSVVIAEIFSHLGQGSRTNASLVCHSWRDLYFLPRFWPSVRFVIGTDSPGCARFLINKFAKTVIEAKIVVNSLAPECLQEFILLLYILSQNNNLRSIVLEPTHCSFARWDCDEWKEVTNILNKCLPRLTEFSIGCIEELYFCLETIIKHLDPASVTKLGLASVRDNFVEYSTKLFDPVILNPFTRLEELTVNYVQLSDTLLALLDCTKELKNLTIHVNADDSPDFMSRTWYNFREKHHGLVINCRKLPERRLRKGNC